MKKKTMNAPKVSYSKAVDIKRLDFIVNAIQNHTNCQVKVLDVGCGNGLISIQLGQMGFEVKGIDISEKAILKAAAANNLSNVSFEVIDAEELKVQHQKYDVIICSEVLEHLHKPEIMVKTLHTLLTNDGILIITVPNGLGPRELLITKPMQWIQQKSPVLWSSVSKIKKAMGYDGTTEQSAADDLTHIHFFTKKALRKLSGNSDFKLVDFGKANFLADVFPFSLAAKRSIKLQWADCKTADILPHYFACGFNTVWVKNRINYG